MELEKNRKPAKKKKSTPASLLDKESMGGIHGGDGYDFQTRYIACHALEWIARGDELIEALIEGSGDVDVKFKGKKPSAVVREHNQVKKHPVGAAELKEIIKRFHKLDVDFKNGYSKFRLACPEITGEAAPLVTALKRYNGSSDFFREHPEALRSTVKELKSIIKGLGLAKYSAFILDKVELDCGHGAFNCDKASCELFVAKMLALPKFQKHLLAQVRPAYKAVVSLIFSHRARVLRHDSIVEELENAIKKIMGAEEAVTVACHNWEKNVSETKVDHELDWTSHFDRSTRRVPPSSVWNTSLMPELRKLQQDLVKGPARMIRFRGKATLSTGLAFGHVFPRSGGWTIDCVQFPKNEVWRSDAPIKPSYPLKYNEKRIGSRGDSIAAVFNITGSAKADVAAYIEAAKLPVKAIISIEPEGGGGSSSIAGAGESVSLAQEARDRLKAALTKFEVKKTHLFFFGPQGLALFLGQRLTSVGTIQLYEWQEPSYVPSISFSS